MKRQKIDYYLIAFAQDYYVRKGFELVEAPWTVKEEHGNLTKPDWRRNFWVKDKVLVGSAEQGFISMFFEGTLKAGKYVATTPCFRDEPRVGWLHQNYFLKTELIEIGQVGVDELDRMIGCANDFFSMFLKTKVVKTEKNRFDIVDSGSGVELGSYGLEKLVFEGKEMNYVYGTGCALPRLSTVISRYRKKGYHDDINIPKTKFGSLEKILEEVWEMRDATLQGNKLLLLCEFADLIGAVEGYVGNDFELGITDLKLMSQLTKRAFEVGSR